jgi:hypothetical protein
MIERVLPHPAIEKHANRQQNLLYTSIIKLIGLKNSAETAALGIVHTLLVDRLAVAGNKRLSHDSNS